MLDRLLPPRLDNDYRGHKLALWLFGLVVLMKLGMSIGTILNGRVVASTTDGIPLETYGPAGAQTVVALLALLGAAQLLLALVCVVALVRYRAMVPSLLALLVLDYLIRRVVLRFIPIVRTGTPPGVFINIALLAMMIAALALSLRRARTAAG